MNPVIYKENRDWHLRICSVKAIIRFNECSLYLYILLLFNSYSELNSVSLVWFNLTPHLSMVLLQEFHGICQSVQVLVLQSTLNEL